MKFRTVFGSSRLGSALVALVVLMLGGCGEPDFRYLDGRAGSLRDFDGRWLVINFWAQWCKPCREEMPALSRFQHAHPDVGVIGVSFDPLPVAELERIQREWRIGYPLLRSEPAPRLGVDMPAGLPATWLRSPDGRLVGPLFGTQTEDSLAAAIAKARQEEKP